jgi:ABC-type sugar transport system ATPase subunit
MTDGDPVLRITDAVKRFGSVTALDDASLSVGRGEVLALLGDNGAGKSTLVKCVTGVHTFDHGVVELNGEPVRIKSPQDARNVGIETVYQDLALFDNLPAVANFYAGRELARPRWLGHLGWLSERAMKQHTAELVNRLKVNLPDPGAAVGLMSGGQRQAVACARAVAFASELVILDEPTAALGLRESQNVLDLIRRLADQGIGVLLVSHNLEQVGRVADRAIVLRRGHVVGEAVPTPDNHELLVSLIVGTKALEATV